MKDCRLASGLVIVVLTIVQALGYDFHREIESYCSSFTVLADFVPLAALMDQVWLQLLIVIRYLQGWL